MQIEPTNPIENLIRLLIAVFVTVTGVMGARQTMDRPPALGPATPVPAAITPTPVVVQAAPYQSLTLISKVDALILESAPPQLQLVIKGDHPDGCQLPVKVEQRRDGKQVFVKIYREIPGDILCTMALQPYEDTIKLDGPFAAGDYTIDVNGFVLTVKI
jgi:hypothetical protein